MLLDPGRGEPVPVLCASRFATNSMEPLYLLLAVAWLGLSPILTLYPHLCFWPSTQSSLAFGASDRMLCHAPARCCTMLRVLQPLPWGLLCVISCCVCVISQLHNPYSSFAGQAQIWLSLWHSFHFSTAWL